VDPGRDHVLDCVESMVFIVGWTIAISELRIICKRSTSSYWIGLIHGVFICIYIYSYTRNVWWVRPNFCEELNYGLTVKLLSGKSIIAVLKRHTDIETWWLPLKCWNIGIQFWISWSFMGKDVCCWCLFWSMALYCYFFSSFIFCFLAGFQHLYMLWYR